MRMKIICKFIYKKQILHARQMISEMEQPYFSVSALHMSLYRLGDIDHVEIHVGVEEERQ